MFRNFDILLEFRNDVILSLSLSVSLSITLFDILLGTLSGILSTIGHFLSNPFNTLRYFVW